MTTALPPPRAAFGLLAAAIADALAEAKAAGTPPDALALVRRIADYLALTNPRFDRAKFLTRAGLGQAPLGQGQAGGAQRDPARDPAHV